MLSVNKTISLIALVALISTSANAETLADIYQLAVNMGTSVEMIEDYYSHAKVRDKEFASSMTKGNQKGSSKALPF